MKRTILLACLALVTACAETSEGAGRTGTGGTGTGGNGGTGGTVEPPPPPQSVDATCRDWCANEPEGISCHEGPSESVQDCYEDCLGDYQFELGRQCEDEWIAIKSCQVDLECQDLFGDCDERGEQYQECLAIASNRVFCEANCPELDLQQCEQDRTECDALLEAKNYCEDACPTQDRMQCIQQYQSTGTCELEEPTDLCRRMCGEQDLNECIEQWLATGRCEFSTDEEAVVNICTDYCPPIGSGNFICLEYWPRHNECPFTQDVTTCTLLCLWECPVGGVPVTQAFEDCVNSCEQLYPNHADCFNEAGQLSLCFEFGSSGCNTGPGEDCEDHAEEITSCLTGTGGTGGSGGTGGTDGGLPGGACDNESDLDAIESAGSLRDVARNCGLINCANFVGNSSGYESCVTECVAFSAQALSSECAGCYGGAERCSHDWFCRGPCQNDTCSTTCLECMNGADCILDFEECRGLPGDGCAGTP